MESFYKNWLKKNLERRNRGPSVIPSGTGDDDENEPIASTSNTVPPPQRVPKEPSEIIYENNFLKLIVEKGSFKKQKLFRLQDHLFYFKIEQKRPHDSLPMLSDIFDFLHAALLHVLESIKSFYKQEDHNIAYLTLHQEPMVNGLNTGLTIINVS